MCSEENKQTKQHCKDSAVALGLKDFCKSQDLFISGPLLLYITVTIPWHCVYCEDYFINNNKKLKYNEMGAV